MVRPVPEIMRKIPLARSLAAMLLLTFIGDGPVLAADRLILDVIDARSAKSRNDPGRNVVTFRLSRDSAGDFAIWTGKYVGRTINLYVDGRKIASPRLMSPISGGSGQLSVQTTRAAVELARILRNGSATLSVDVKD